VRKCLCAESRCQALWRPLTVIRNPLELDLPYSIPTVFGVPSHYYQLDSRTVSERVQRKNPTFTDHDPILGIGGRPLRGFSPTY
jgi:hypothetical protein